METEEELVLLKEYMGYFINLRHYKATYDIKLKDWDGNGPRPSLNFRSKKDMEPLSFKDWIDFYDKDKN